MAKCTHTEDNTVERYILNQLTEKEEAAFQEHLSRCGDCAARVRAVRGLAGSLADDAVTGKAAGKQLADDLVSGMSIKETGKRDRAAIRRRMRVIGSVSVAAAVIGAVILLRMPGGMNNGLPVAAVNDTADNNILVPVRDTIPNDSGMDSGKPLGGQENIMAQDAAQDKGDSMPDVMDTARVIKGRAYASADSVRQGGGIVAHEPLKMLSPDKADYTFILGSDGGDEFRFRWTGGGKASVLVLKRGKTILGRFVSENEMVKVDMAAYAEYGEIEWVLMSESADNRIQGAISLKKR